jgi:hypothetical protein
MELTCLVSMLVGTMLCLMAKCNIFAERHHANCWGYTVHLKARDLLQDRQLSMTAH